MRTVPWSFALGLALATPGAAAQNPDPSEPPGLAGEPARALGVAQADDPEARSALDAQLVGGIASLGVGLGFVVAFNYAFFRVNDLLSDPGFVLYRKGIGKDESSCELARQGVVAARPDAPAPADIASLCGELDSTLLFRNVALPIGLVEPCSSAPATRSSVPSKRAAGTFAFRWRAVPAA
jgi:hypothetical protein